MIADVISDLFEAFFMTVMIPFYPSSHGNAFEVLLL